ncbi:nitrogen fixation protein NifQ [Achromobacter pulmonis]|uniref:Nitrogen fixation protein NifQ n=1 Tax=Achromobacter pulmonis TaxID=1389932 RepID=A0A2N8KGV4_9BURK|nr:nitrogen fixation protein NifQ [Achromobacter pulmonis]PND32685.1 nitrogen fixation protein NifQ [Achromobacter pulmonis]
MQTPALADTDRAERLAQTLLRHAPPCHPDAGFFAAVLGKRLALGDLGGCGLTPQELDGLLARLFPGAAPAELRAQRAALAAPVLDAKQAAFKQMLRGLLQAWSVPAADITAWVTGALAHACLRPDHLWRDLGLSGREDVTALLARHYPGLVARNVGNLRWKQFLAYAAYERAGLAPAQAPGCPACEDYGVCYPQPLQ